MQSLISSEKAVASVRRGSKRSRAESSSARTNPVKVQPFFPDQDERREQAEESKAGKAPRSPNQVVIVSDVVPFEADYEDEVVPLKGAPVPSDGEEEAVM